MNQILTKVSHYLNVKNTILIYMRRLTILLAMILVLTGCEVLDTQTSGGGSTRSASKGHRAAGNTKVGGRSTGGSKGFSGFAGLFSGGGGSSSIGRTATSMVGHQDYGSAPVGLKCAAQVSTILKRSGVKIAGSAGVTTVISQLKRIGWKACVGGKRPGDVVYSNSAYGNGSRSHIGVVGARGEIVHNSGRTLVTSNTARQPYNVRWYSIVKCLRAP
ncbi:hypothetical protein GW915_02990 [bacterium]|nr:hypothetical protein [bacterium]